MHISEDSPVLNEKKSLIVVRYAKPADMPKARELVRKTWLHTYPNEAFGISREDIAHHLDPSHPENASRVQSDSLVNTQQDYFVLVAYHRKKKKLVGFCRGSREHAEIRSLYVLPAYQRLGVGSALLADAIRLIGIENHVSLQVVRYNYDAITFYERFGFRVVRALPSSATRPLRGSNKKLPQVLMRREGKR